MSGNRRDGQALQGRAGLHCANPDVLLGDGTVLPPSSSLPCSWAAGLTCSEPCKGHLRHLSMLIPKQSWAAAHSHPHPGCSSLLSELCMLASGKFFMYKTTGNKSSVSGIFLIIFWNFTLSFLQVLFQSSSTKKVVWGSIYLYFRSSYCPGIKHFEFYIGHKKAKVSSWEIALKITKDFMWDCLRSFYMLFLTVFKVSPFSLKCLCHSLTSAVQTGRAAGQAPQRDTHGKKHSKFWTPPKWI